MSELKENLKKEETNTLVPFDIHKFIDECMCKKDRYVTIYFGEFGVSVSVYPLTAEGEDE